MALPRVDHVVIGRLDTIREHAERGDRDALRMVNEAKMRAARGDATGTAAVKILEALKLHAALHRGEPAACRHAAALVKAAKAGDKNAKESLAIMASSAQHGGGGSLFSSPGAPGAARMGGYGMPGRSRPGVMFGAATLQQVAELGQMIDRAILSRPVMMSYAAAAPTEKLIGEWAGAKLDDRAAMLQKYGIANVTAVSSNTTLSRRF